MSANNLSLAGVATEYLATLPQTERLEQQQEVMRFIRWYGPEAPIADMGMRTLESYLSEVEASGADSARRLMPLRSFLAYAEDQGYMTDKLSKLVRVKRVTSKGKKAAANSQTVEREVIHLTPEGHSQLKEELEHLVNVMRPQVADALLEARRDKDIRENAPYDAAKQQQGYIEARIRELEHIMAVGEVLAEARPRPGGRVGIGSTVLLRDLTYDDVVRYTLVSSSEANPREGKLSVASPVGRALLDQSEGSEIEVEAPAGKLRYRVEKVER
jgi:transcription elongation factor GreA